MNPHTYGHMIFDKGATAIQWKKDSLSTNGAGSIRRMQINPFFSLCTKLNSKRIKDLHIKPDTLKLIEKKLGENP